MPERGEVLASGTLADLLSIIEAIVEPQMREGIYVLYGPIGAESLDETMPCAIIFMPDYEQDDWLPDFATEHGLEVVTTVTLMQDVIRNSRYQVPDPTISELVTGLNYFADYDAFLDLGFYRLWRKYRQLE